MIKYKFIYFFIILTFINAQFDWIDNGAPIRQGQHIEWQRTADSGGSGEVIFAWSDTRESIRDVYAQKVDAEGNILWGEQGIPVAKAYGRQEDPLLVSDGQGGAFIIWIDYRDEPDTQGDVYAQHILSDGSLVWDIEGFPIVVKPGAQRSPNMCMDGEGGAYIIWKDFTFGQYDRVYASHISSDNQVINSGEGIPIITNDSNHSGISLEIAGNGEAAMVWVDDRNINSDIFGQRIKADHENNTISTLWSTVEEGGKAICDAEGDQKYAKITYAVGCCGDDMGITVAVWQDDRNNNFDVYMQYLWIDGSAYFQEYPLGLPLTDLPSSQTKPRVKADNSGAYVAWYDDSNSGDIYAQKVIFSQDDAIQWQDNGLPICEVEQTQTDVRLSVDGLGGAYFVWQDDRSGGDEADVYLQHVDENNEFTYDIGGKSISSASLQQISPVVRNDGSGGAFVIWEDKREGSGAIYVQHLAYMDDISFEENGKFVYYGTDGESLNINAVDVDSDRALVYWEDHEQGNFSINYGKLISSDYGNSYENAISSQKKILSNNPSQYNPDIKVVDDKLFFGFLQNNYEAQFEPFEGYSQFFQMIQLPDLDLIGNQNGTWLNNSIQYSYISDNARSVVLSVNNQDEIFYFTSLSEFFAGVDIYVRKISSDGTIYWDAPINLTNDFNTDSFVKKAFSNPENGSFIVYEESGGGNKFGYISSIDENGVIIDGFPKRICDIDSQQSIQDAVDTGEGILVIWEDNRYEGSDIYAQYFDYSGNKLGVYGGIVVASYDYDQSNARADFNSALNESLICWEDYYGIEGVCSAVNDQESCENTIDCEWVDNSCSSVTGNNYEIYCNTVDLGTLSINENSDGGPLYTIADGQGDQINPDVYSAVNGHYMIVWEDSRFDDGNNYQTHTDVYYQEINQEGDFVYENGGAIVCDAFHIQTKPKITLYSNDDESQSYLIYWRDLRSTGKDLLYNIYGQSITHQSSLGISDNTDKEFQLNSIYPNPFNPQVNINFFNPAQSDVKISIYDLNGRLIEQVYNGLLGYGNHNFIWNAESYSSGIYLVTLSSETNNISSKISLIK